MTNGDVAFRFRIGDVVDHKIALQTPDAQRFIILARLTEECSGGTQRHYVTRGVMPQGFSAGAVTGGDIRFHEFEVERALETGS